MKNKIILYYFLVYNISIQLYVASKSAVLPDRKWGHRWYLKNNFLL